MAYLVKNKTTFGVSTLLATALTFSSTVMAGGGDEDAPSVKKVQGSPVIVAETENSGALPPELAPWMQLLPEAERTLENQNVVLQLAAYDVSCNLSNTIPHRINKILKFPPSSIMPLCRAMLQRLLQEEKEYDRIKPLYNMVDGVLLFKGALDSDSVWVPDTVVDQIREAVIQLFAAPSRPCGIKIICNNVKAVPEEERAPLLLRLYGYKKYLSRSSQLFPMFSLLHLIPEDQRAEGIRLLMELSGGWSLRELRAHLAETDKDLRLAFLQRIIPLLSERSVHSRIDIVNAATQILSVDLLQEGALEALVSILSHVEDTGKSTNLPSNFLKAFLQLPVAKRPMIVFAMKGGEELKPAALKTALEGLQVVPENALTEELVKNVIIVLRKYGGRRLVLKSALEHHDRARALHEAANSATKEGAKSALRKLQ